MFDASVAFRKFDQYEKCERFEVVQKPDELNNELRVIAIKAMQRILTFDVLKEEELYILHKKP